MLAFADRCAGDDVRLVRHPVEAAVMADPCRHGRHGGVVVAIAIAWRNNDDHERSVTEFAST